MMSATLRALLCLALTTCSHSLQINAQLNLFSLRRCQPLRMCDALNGAFWGAFTTEAKAEAEALGLGEEITFSGGKLAVLASGAGVDELQQLNSHLSSFIDAQGDDEEESSRCRPSCWRSRRPDLAMR